MEITPNVILCVNLLDEAKKKKIKIDLKKLSKLLGIPVVGTIARKKHTLDNLMNTILKVCTKEIIPNPIPVDYSVETDCLSSKITDLKSDMDDKSILNKKNSKSDVSGEPISAKDDDIVISAIMKYAEKICKEVCTFEDSAYSKRDRKIDKILTSKIWGFPIMLLFLGLIFWITIVGANYPSQALFMMFSWIQEKLVFVANYLHFPSWLSSMCINGIYQTLTWIIAVMLPPMAIFFPLFTFMEDLGYLPRIAFNMDGFFKKCCCNGKQAITMCMGFGCNAAGVTGCRIFSSPREKLIAILTNNFVPCNGRFPFLISVATIFIAGSMNGIGASIVSTLAVILVILLGIFCTLLVSKILSKTILKGMPSSFILELPPYRKPQFGKIFIRSIFDRTIFVLGRAICVAAPAGLIIWLFANIGIDGTSLLSIVANFLEPLARLMGLDGYILTAFVFGIPANEIVLPIIIMCYLGGTSLVNLDDTFSIGQILANNGWTLLTALNVMIFTCLHFPCATTLLTIKKETGSWKWVGLSFILPTLCGIIICMFTTLIYNIIV